jgi:hypothetical protein
MTNLQIPKVTPSATPWRTLQLDAIAASVKLPMVINSGHYYNSFAGWQFSPVGWRVRLR